jgi:chromosome segregation ATPase
VLTFQANLDKNTRQLKDLQSRHKELSTDQARVRENLKILPKDSAPFKRFLDKFEKQETQIEELQTQIRTA